MFIPIMIPIQTYPQYVKREDLDSYIEKYKKRAKIGMISVVLGGLFVEALIGFLVMPKLFGLYTTVNQTAPAYSVPLMFVSAGLGLVLLTVAAMSNPLDMNKVEQAKQDKNEMVTIKNPLMNSKLAWLFYGYIVIAVLTVIVTTILPIYGLTSSLQ